MNKKAYFITTIENGVHKNTICDYSIKKAQVKFENILNLYNIPYVNGLLSYEKNNIKVSLKEIDLSFEILNGDKFALLIVIIDEVIFNQKIFTTSDKANEYLNEGLIDMIEDDDGVEACILMFDLIIDEN